MKSKSNGKDFCTFALPGLFCFLAVVIVPFLYGVYLTLTVRSSKQSARCRDLEYSKILPSFK